MSIQRFAENQDGVAILAKRKISEVEAADTHLDHRKRVLDETIKEVITLLKQLHITSYGVLRIG